MDLRNQGERGRLPEDQREEMGELTCKADGQAGRLDPFNLVRAKLGESAPCLGLADALRPAMQAGQGVLESELMDPHPVNLAGPRSRQKEVTHLDPYR